MSNPARSIFAFGFNGLLSGNLSKARRTIIGDGLWVSVGQFVSAIGALVGVRLLTEFIDPEVFGGVSLFLGVILLGTNLACAPLFQAVLRFYPDLAVEGRLPILRETVRRMLSNVMLFLVLTLGVAAGIHSFIEHRLMWIYLPVAILLFVEILRGLDINFLSAARRHRPFAIWTGLDSLARPFGAILAVLLWDASPSAVLIGYAVASAFGYLLFRCLGKPEGTGSPAQALTDDVSLRRQILGYALPLVPLALE